MNEVDGLATSMAGKTFEESLALAVKEMRELDGDALPTTYVNFNLPSITSHWESVWGGNLPLKDHNAPTHSFTLRLAVHALVTAPSRPSDSTGFSMGTDGHTSLTATSNTCAPIGTDLRRQSICSPSRAVVYIKAPYCRRSGRPIWPTERIIMVQYTISSPSGRVNHFPPHHSVHCPGLTVGSTSVRGR